MQLPRQRKPMTFRQHLERMCMNYRVKTFEEVREMFLRVSSGSKRIPVEVKKTSGLSIIFEKTRVTGSIPTEELKEGMSERQYISNYKFLRNHGASTDEAILLSVLN